MATKGASKPVPGIRGRTRRKRTRQSPGAPVTVQELVASVPCDLSVPLVFLMLARRYSDSVKAYPHRRDPAKWCFRFGVRSIVEVSVDGQAEWISGTPEMRRDVEALVECARLRHAELQAPRQASCEAPVSRIALAS